MYAREFGSVAMLVANVVLPVFGDPKITKFNGKVPRKCCLIPESLLLNND